MSDIWILLGGMSAVFVSIVLFLAGKDLFAIIGQFFEDVFEHLHLWYVSKWLQHQMVEPQKEIRHDWQWRHFRVIGGAGPTRLNKRVALKWYRDGAEPFRLLPSPGFVFLHIQRKRDGKIYS